MKNMSMKTKLVFILSVIAVLVLFFIAGCKTTKPVSQAGSIPPDFVPVKHVVFIGLDGWGGYYIPKANMPTVKRMMSKGAWTLAARSVKPNISWPNWSSIFLGAPPEQRHKEDFPSIFTLLKNNGQAKKTVFFYEWEELQKIYDFDAVETKEILSNIESTMKIAAYIKEQKPVFTAISFDEPDNTGHTIGWGSKAYYAKHEEMDNLIAAIEQAVKDAGIYDSTVFVFSADHGGAFKGHSGYFPKHYKIPMIFYGSGIKEGFNITSHVNIYDITPTMAALLGMEIPPEWTGRVLYEIFK
jgi:predicted AlkP superfamily pyrophosphatase or phosphodiesterase